MSGRDIHSEGQMKIFGRLFKKWGFITDFLLDLVESYNSCK